MKNIIPFLKETINKFMISMKSNDFLLDILSVCVYIISNFNYS